MTSKLNHLVNTLRRSGLGRESDIHMNTIRGQAHSYDGHIVAHSNAYLKLALSCILSLLLNTAWAHGDEVHGAKPAIVSGALMPSAEAKSDDFELLAQMKGSTLQVYLDRYSDNAPIAGAKIEVESGAFKAQLKANTAGEYSTEAPALTAVGDHALVFTVIAGEQSDLLETTLKVAQPATAEHSPKSGAMWWWVGGGLAGFAALSFILNRQRRSSRKSLGVKA